MSTVAISRTMVVSQADVLYVTQQIVLDLRALRMAYPQALSEGQILDVDRAVGTFLLNDAVAEIGFALATSRPRGTVLHELRYPIRYGEPEPRSGRGGVAVTPVARARRCVFVPWVAWSERMLGLSADEQAEILEGTGWSPPGVYVLELNYPPGSTHLRGHYRSGPLDATAQEFRSRG